MSLPFGDGSFREFSDQLTGYRLSTVLMLLEESALFAFIGDQGESLGSICARIGWDQAYGKRFLDCLCRLGLLELRDDRYAASRLSRAFLCHNSPAYQGHTLRFEQQLLQSWQQLGATLKAGKRVFAAGDKPDEELNQAFSLYLGSMDEAATIRAEELWQTFGPIRQQGLILDLGAGSGAYLAAFLARHPLWRAIYCDLPQVVDSAAHHRLDNDDARISWCRCNLLSEETIELDAIEPGSCDLVLLSNLLHCQGETETNRIVQRAAEKTAPEGLLLIHDFFSDCDWRGALYDLHMMLNTYNGRTYTVQECVDMAAESGFCCHRSQTLVSGSTLLTFARNESMLRFPTP